MIHVLRLNQKRLESYRKYGPGSSTWSNDEKILAGVVVALVVVLIASILVHHFK